MASRSLSPLSASSVPVRPNSELFAGLLFLIYLKAHSDWIDQQKDQPSGPRVFTFF